MTNTPETLSEERTEFHSGCRLMVRAATFAVGQERRAAVMVTVLVPDGFFQQVKGGGASCTAMVTPAEARKLGAELLAAAETAASAAHRCTDDVDRQ
jgi:hypothetical protein